MGRSHWNAADHGTRYAGTPGGILPFEKLFADEHRFHRQTIGQTEQHSAIMVACRVFPLVCRQLVQPLLQFLFQCGGHEDGAAGGCRFGTFQDEGSGAALQLIRGTP